MKKILLIFVFVFIQFVEGKESTEIFNLNSKNKIPVFISEPERIDDKTRLVIVMHGRKRNAETYRDQWIESSKTLNLLVVVPEFSEAAYPGVYGFNYGNVFDQEGNQISQAEHTLSYIEPLAKHYLSKYSLNHKWGIYGHGAGAHFVHRLVLHKPNLDYTLAIAANLGWYLTPQDISWPFGLKDSGISEDNIAQAYRKYFLLLLGKSDLSTKPNTPYVASIFDKVTAQGIHRLDRGRNFFKQSIAKARSMDIFLKWGMVEVPTKDGHSNTQQMVPYAAELFYERLR